jgi:cupin fold WbuC family metalloprotein
MQTSPIKRLDRKSIDCIASQARQSPRLRQNYNFHDSAERVQRFINILQPGTYVRPHRHCRDRGVNGFEFFLVCQGALGMIVMSDRGEIVATELVSAGGKVWAIELPEATYHTIVALTPDTMILELKEGPYDSSTDKEFLDEFPAEGTNAAKQLVREWEKFFT